MYAHGAVAARYLGVEFFHGVISKRWRELSAPKELMATLVFLEKMTLRPLELEVSDVLAAREAGVEQIDLEHAVMVGSMFGSMNRLVDAFGADLSEEQSGRLGSMLNVMDRVISRGSGKKDPPVGPGLPPYVEKILQPIREQEGDSPAALRRAIDARLGSALGVPRSAQTQDLPPELATLVDLIADDVWGLTDEHFDALKQTWSEEAIYEFVYTACMTAGLVRLERTWPLITEAFTP